MHTINVFVNKCKIEEMLLIFVFIHFLWKYDDELITTYKNVCYNAMVMAHVFIFCARHLSTEIEKPLL